MSDTYTAVDLSRLPALDLIEPLNFESILARIVDRLREIHPEFTALLESDPAYALAEVSAYGELLLRQRINDAAKSVMLAYATGTALDHLAAGYNVQRLLITPADPDASPPVAAVFEPDADLRRRVQLSFEGFSTAGPAGAYIFHALSAHADVQDASVSSPLPCEVVVTVLSRSANGAASPELLDAVASTLNHDDVRPLTDQVSVQPAVIVNYEVTAELLLWSGPDANVVMATANARLDQFIAENKRLGRDITRSGLYAALHVEGVQNVVLSAPAADVVIGAAQAAFCTAKAITYRPTEDA